MDVEPRRPTAPLEELDVPEPDRPDPSHILAIRDAAFDARERKVGPVVLPARERRPACVPEAAGGEAAEPPQAGASAARATACASQEDVVQSLSRSQSVPEAPGREAAGRRSAEAMGQALSKSQSFREAAGAPVAGSPTAEASTRTGRLARGCTPMSRTSSSSRHNDDFFDYFLSHKKTHSKLGKLPEQVAKNIHDALEIHGHKGFFDVDDLDEISKENVEACIECSSTMIVYMNDETMQSEWCLFEWKVAHEKGIPIRVVADVSNCVKGDLVDMVQTSDYAFLLKHQWMEYSDSTRRSVAQFLSHWINQEGGAIVNAARCLQEGAVCIFTSNGALCIMEGGKETQLFHRFFECYMVACGLVYNKEAWSLPVLIWTKVVRTMSLACFGICFWRLVYATGPAYTDWFSCLYVVFIHVFLYHGLFHMTRLLPSDVMKGFLLHVASSALAARTVRRINNISKWAAIIGFSAGVACTLAMIVIYLPLFLSEFYRATPMGTAFGFSSAILFVSVAPIVLVQEFAVLTLLFTTTQLLVDVYESSVCSLHDVVPQVGLRKFVRGSRQGFAPTDAQLGKFGSMWSNSILLQKRLQVCVNPVVCVHLVLNLMGVLIPFAYLVLHGDDFLEPGPSPFSKWAKPILWWGFSALCYSAAVFIPAFTSYCLDDLAEEAQCLPIPPKTQEFLLMRLHANLDWRIGPVRLTSFCGMALLCPVLGSAVCWVIVLSEVFG